MPNAFEYHWTRYLIYNILMRTLSCRSFINPISIALISACSEQRTKKTHKNPNSNRFICGFFSLFSFAVRKRKSVNLQNYELVNMYQVVGCSIHRVDVLLLLSYTVFFLSLLHFFFSFSVLLDPFPMQLVGFVCACGMWMWLFIKIYFR